jgi:hypothetical protein
MPGQEQTPLLKKQKCKGGSCTAGRSEPAAGIFLWKSEKLSHTRKEKT